MEKLTVMNYKCFLALTTFLSLISCNTKHDMPFPEKETEFEQPTTRPLHLPAAVKINWIVNKEDSIPPPLEQPFDIDKISSKPFYVNGFKPFVKPPAEEKLDWDKLPSTPFDIDTVPAKPLVYKTVRINAPVRIKAGIPKAKTPVSKNIVQLGEDEGLPVGTVQQICQDKKGIYWIATGRGLCRYDGEYFELFSFISKEPQGGVQILKMVEDSSGKLWIRTQTRGIYRFDPSTGIAVNIENMAYDITIDSGGSVWMLSNNDGILIIDPEKLSAQRIDPNRFSDSGQVARVTEGDKGNMLFRTLEGITMLDKEKKKIVQWHSKAAPDLNTIFYFLKTAAGNILIGTKEGIDVINPNTSLIQHFTKEQGLENKVLPYAPTEDNKGHIWQARGDSGIEVLDLKNNTALKLKKKDGLSENNIVCLYHDKDGKTWLGTGSGGINIIDNNISVNHLSVDQGLSNNHVWSLLEDTKGKIWLGSRGSNKDVLNTEQNTIQHFTTSTQPSTGFNSVPNIMLDKNGHIWSFSTNSPLSMLDIENKRTKLYDKKYLPFRTGLKLLGDSRGMVWISTFGEGILLFDPQKNIFRHLNTSNGLAGNLPWRLLEDKNGRIWVATSKGLSIIEANGETMTSLHKMDGLSDNVIQSLAQDSLGRMWVSTNEGIDMLDLDKKTVTAFTKTQGLAENESYALEVLNGKVYAGTSSGINIIENIGHGIDNWKINTLARPQGFYYLDVNSNTSLISRGGKIWWGILETLTVMDEPHEDSMIKPAYITGIAVNGLQQFFYTPEKISPAKTVTDTIWSELKDTFYTRQNIGKTYAKGNAIQWDSTEGIFNMPVGLEVAYNQNQLSFQFTGMHTDNADKVKYRYILEGLNDEWSAITDQAKSPDYNNLSSGKYTFKVCSKGANGLWSKPAVFSFTILPPWWKTWWAYTLYALAFAAIVRAYILYRSRRLLKENSMLEEKINLRTTELKQSIDHLQSTQSQLIQSEKMASLGELTAGIAHEIQNPLNFVNNFSEVNTELLEELKAERLKPDAERDDNLQNDLINDVIANEEKINHHGKRADAIVKGMLQHSRSSTGQKEPTDINALADEYLRLSYHGLRAKDKLFNTTLKTDFDDSIGNINIIPQDIGRVLLNLFNNAFFAVQQKQKESARTEVTPFQKVSPLYESTISISTKKVNGVVELRVKDNGNGIPQKIVDKIFQPFFTTKPTGQGTGLGLSLSYDIVKAHGGEVKVETVEGEGSEFIIQLPVV